MWGPTNESARRGRRNADSSGMAIMAVESRPWRRGGMASCLRVVLDDDPILPHVDTVLGGGRHDHEAGDERSEEEHEMSALMRLYFKLMSHPFSAWTHWLFPGLGR
jgi:hypothetical protein